MLESSKPSEEPTPIPIRVKKTRNLIPMTLPEIPSIPRSYQTSLEDKLSHLRGEVAYLESELRRLEDTISHKDAGLGEVIGYLENGISTGRWKGYSEVKRMLSRTKGALGFRGSSEADFSPLCLTCGKRTAQHKCDVAPTPDTCPHCKEPFRVKKLEYTCKCREKKPKQPSKSQLVEPSELETRITEAS